MKLDIEPIRSTYVAPNFGGEDHAPLDPALKRRLHRPMKVGGLVIGVFVIGLGLWASLYSRDTGITAGGAVKVESNRKTMRHREGGVVRQILVKEGQHVRAGQPLIVFDDVEPRAANDVFQSQYDGLLAQVARYQAEGTGKSSLEFPPELTARMSEPAVAGMIRDQQFLFTTRMPSSTRARPRCSNQRLDQIQQPGPGPADPGGLGGRAASSLTNGADGRLSDAVRQGLSRLSR